MKLRDFHNFDPHIAVSKFIQLIKFEIANFWIALELELWSICESVLFRNTVFLPYFHVFMIMYTYGIHCLVLLVRITPPPLHYLQYFSTHSYEFSTEQYQILGFYIHNKTSFFSHITQFWESYNSVELSMKLGSTAQKARYELYKGKMPVYSLNVPIWVYTASCIRSSLRNNFSIL